MTGNANFTAAKHMKNDEFYTLLSDVTQELQHYEKQLHGKVILCNCNDDEASAFWLYLSEQFGSLALKKLIAVKYGASAYKLEMTGTGQVTKTSCMVMGISGAQSAWCY